MSIATKKDDLMDDAKAKEDDHQAESNLLKQWMWFIGLWVSGLVAVGTLAYGIRLMMGIE